MLNELRMVAGFAARLGPFLRHPLSPAACRERLTTRLRDRESSFLTLLERGVYAQPSSPYRALLEHAGCELGDIRAMIAADGLEATLERLHEEGVRLSIAEFKGRAPIRRGSLEMAVRSRQFDNPLAARHYRVATGGSRGPRTRLFVDFDVLAHEAAYMRLFVEAFGIEDRPEAVWWPVPPGSAGLKNVLRRAKMGAPNARWFSQHPLLHRPGSMKTALFMDVARLMSRLAGQPIPRPEHVPLGDAAFVARWLSEQLKSGTPSMVATTVGAGVRICLAAREHGIDIAGSFVRLGGEPLTPARARLFDEAGCRAAPFYAMAEVGLIGMPCAHGDAPDDVHLMTDKMASLQRPHVPTGAAEPVGALHHTTLLPMCNKIMINVESGDYAEIGDRTCGCEIGRLGFARHLRMIRSYEKLTVEGMTFLGDDVIRLVEEVLPARFGGHPTDYQFVEEAGVGPDRLSILVSPKVGAIDEDALLRTVREELSRGYDAARMMASVWSEAGTLRVQRREPHATGVAKILAVHLIGARDTPEQS